MKKKIYTISVTSCYHTPAEVEKYSKEFMKNYKVSGIFHDGGDQYSSWTLTGTLKAIQKCIDEKWLCHGYLNYNDVIENLNDLKLFMTEQEIELNH